MQWSSYNSLTNANTNLINSSLIFDNHSQFAIKHWKLAYMAMGKKLINTIKWSKQWKLWMREKKK